MGTISLVNGCIQLPVTDRYNDGVRPYRQQQQLLLQDAMHTINAFEFDEVYPFTNIFWGGSPAQYFLPVVIFGGSYKQIEESWNEWLWKFSQMLSTLEAAKACVHLECIYGKFSWRLEPRSRHFGVVARPPYKGEQWGIVEGPEDDFITGLPDAPQRGLSGRWDKFVEQWTKPHDRGG